MAIKFFFSFRQFKEELKILQKHSKKEDSLTSNIQHDVAEFITLLLEYLKNEITSQHNIQIPSNDRCYSIKDNTFEEVFNCDLNVPYECSNCKHIRRNKVHSIMLYCELSRSKIKNCELSDLLKNTHSLPDEGQPLNCSECCNTVYHEEKRKTILNFPDILIVQLQRYDTSENGISEKREDAVVSSELLDLEFLSRYE